MPVAAAHGLPIDPTPARRPSTARPRTGTAAPPRGRRTAGGRPSRRRAAPRPRRRAAARRRQPARARRSRSARTASTSSADTATDIRASASDVRRAECPAKFACDSIPDCTVVVCDAAVAASERTSAAAACAVYSRIIAPESGPGFCASCGVSPVTSGSSSALTRAATSDADCAIAPRSESSASVSTPAWKLPFGSATPSRGSISAFSPATLSSISSTLERAARAPRAASPRPAARSGTRTRRGSARAPGSPLALAEQPAQAPRDLDLARGAAAPRARAGRARRGRRRSPRRTARRRRARSRAAATRRGRRARPGRSRPRSSS